MRTFSRSTLNAILCNGSMNFTLSLIHAIKIINQTQIISNIYFLNKITKIIKLKKEKCNHKWKIEKNSDSSNLNAF